MTGTDVGSHVAVPTGSVRRAFRTDIQGLRAIAVGLVVLYHAGLPGLTGGFVGVDVFFVISGYLITTHLLESLATDGRVSFARFYARRVRRILPASFVVLVATVAASLVWLPPLQRRTMLEGAIATAAYVPNYLFAVQRTDYLAGAEPSVFQHYWSLGIEEQFYLLWPALLAIAFWAVRRSERRAAWVAGAFVLASFAMCVQLTTASQPWAFFSLHTRAWELGVGGLLAFAVRRFAPDGGWPPSVDGPPGASGLAGSGSAHPLPPALAAGAGWLGLALLAWVALTFDSATPFPGWHAALPVGATALVIAGGTRPTRLGPTALLSVRPMQLLGLISYSLYLVHWPLLTIPQAAVGLADPLPLWLRLALGLAGVPIAYALFRLIEDPARRATWLTRARPRRSLLLAGAGSVAIVALGLATIAVESRDLRGSTGPTVATEPLTTEVVGADVVPANLTPSLVDAADDLPAIYVDGCHRLDEVTDPSGCLWGSVVLEPDDGETSPPLDPAAESYPREPRVVLLGDSHAAQWFPALQTLANEALLELDVNTKNSCPPVDIPVVRDGVPYTECDEWRDGVLARLADDPPEVVVLAGFARSEYLVDDPDLAAHWRAGLTRLISALPDGTDVVVLADTPMMGQDVPGCLSAHLDDAGACARERSAAIDSALLEAERQGTRDGGAQFVDLTDYLCDASECPAIIGNRLVYRDAHHLTRTFATALAPALAEALGLGR